MDPKTFYRCVGCDAEMHYMDTLIVNGERMCLPCVRTLAEGQAAEIARLSAELAQARAERDAEQKRRVFAEEGEENLRFLKKLWENESGFYLRKSHDRYLTIERQRRTIRALVVAARVIWRVLFGVAFYGGAKPTPALVKRMSAEVRFGIREELKQSGQQAGE